jgi:hypothetical protein
MFTSSASNCQPSPGVRSTGQINRNKLAEQNTAAITPAFRHLPTAARSKLVQTLHDSFPSATQKLELSRNPQVSQSRKKSALGGLVKNCKFKVREAWGMRRTYSTSERRKMKQGAEVGLFTKPSGFT